MIDDRARRAHAIFVELLDREPARRSIDDACGDDPALRALVRKLLAAVDASTRFLESPALGAFSPPLPESTLVRGYRIVRVLGAGGMATVYEAEQERPRRRVALKVMHRSLAHTSALRRFQFEAEVLARLKHPGIAQIYEAGAWEDGAGQRVPFFAMEYVENAATITGYAASRPIRERLDMFAEVCDAVQHGHQLGVIHRDLKPSNVLVDRAGRPRIIDFGIARSIQGTDADLTRHGQDAPLLGTLSYMSPEQCSPGAVIDTRADVYALGVILYQLATGRLPHDLSATSLPEAVRVIQHDGPPRAGAIAPEVRGDLDAIIAKAMDKDPERRYDGAGSLAADIRRFLDHRTIQARMPSPWRHARLFARRHKVFVGASAISILAIVGAAAVSTLFAVRSWRDAGRRRAAERAAITERDDARRRAYAASVSSAYLSYQAREFAQGRRRLEGAPGPLRGWEWSLISAFLEPGETVIHAHEDMVDAMDHAAGRLATGSRDGSLALWDARTGDVIARNAGIPRASAMAVALSADGLTVHAGYDDGTVLEWKPGEDNDEDAAHVITTFTTPITSIDRSITGWLAVAPSDGAARVWVPDTPDPPRILADQPGGVTGVRFAADGRTLATWNDGDSVWLRDAESLTPIRTFVLGAGVKAALPNVSGNTLAAGGVEGALRVWRVAEELPILDVRANPGASTVLSLAFAPERSSLYAGQADRVIHEWSLDQGTRRSIAQHDEAVSALAMDESSGRLFSASWDRTLRFWPDPRAATPAPTTSFNAHSDHVLSIAFSPSGELLATAGRDDAIRLWEPATARAVATLSGHAGDVYSVRFAPDGNTLASGSTDGTVRLWSTLTGECAEPLDAGDGPVWSVSFSPDGARLAAAGDRGIVNVWGVPSRSHELRIFAHDHRVNFVAFSPDGTRLATCSRQGLVTLWDAHSGAVIHRFAGHRADAFSCVFSPDGKRLYTGSRDQTVRAWSTQTGALLESLNCPAQFITSLTMDEAGSRLAAGSWYTEVTIWDLRTHDEVFSFKGHSAGIRSVAFAPREPVLACAGLDGCVTIYNAAPAPDRRLARDRAAAGLADAEAWLSGKLTSGLLLDAGTLLTDPADDETMRWRRIAVLERCTSTRTSDGSITPQALPQDK